MIFWDEMWNQSSDDEPKEDTKPTKPKSECCGDWDEFGKCRCRCNKSAK